MTIKDEIDEGVEALKQQRDELHLKMHLAGMEAHEEWDALEEKWDEFANKSRQLKKELDPTLNDINIAYKLLQGELKYGYEKLKNTL